MFLRFRELLVGAGLPNAENDRTDRQSVAIPQPGFANGAIVEPGSLSPRFHDRAMRAVENQTVSFVDAIHLQPHRAALPGPDDPFATVENDGLNPGLSAHRLEHEGFGQAASKTTGPGKSKIETGSSCSHSDSDPNSVAHSPGTMSRFDRADFAQCATHRLPYRIKHRHRHSFPLPPRRQFR